MKNFIILLSLLSLPLMAQFDQFAPSKPQKKPAPQKKTLLNSFHDPIYKLTISYPKYTQFTNDARFTRRVKRFIKKNMDPRLANVGVQFFIFRYKVGTPNLKFNPNINLTTEKLPFWLKDTKSYLNIAIKNAKRYLKSYKIMESLKPINLNGKTFYRLSSSYTQRVGYRTLYLRSLQYCYVHPKSKIAHVFTFTDLSKDYSRHVQSMENILKTIKFDKSY